MNRRPRVLILGRHFWPHGSIDSAGFLYQMASALFRQGIHVEVVTPRYASSWPEQLTVGEMMVHRPAAAPRSDWSLGRYSRHLTAWLREHAAEVDVLLVEGIREESSAVIEAARSLGCVTILRCGGWGDNRDTKWWKTSRGAARCGTIGKMADAVIAKSGECGRALIAEGYAADKVVRIDHGIAPPLNASAESRHAARRALAIANGDLHTETDAPVVLCTSRMTRDGGVSLLVRAARPLIARYPNLRLWFIGDGPYRDWIYQELKSEGVRASIAMPGSFCDCAELFLAADVFFQPDEEGLDFFLPTAIAADLPIVAVENSSTRSVITGSSITGSPNIGVSQRNEPSNLSSQWVQWIAGSTSKQTRIALSQALDDLPQAKANAVSLRRHLLRDRPQNATVQAYLELMERLLARKSGWTRRAEAVS